MNDDQAWTVIKPRNGSAEAIAEMNANMMVFHPALDITRREDHTVMLDANEVLQGDKSIAQLFESILKQP